MELALDFPYTLASTDRVKEQEAELDKELRELKNEIEDFEMSTGTTRVVTSVPVPKDIKHFRMERELLMKRACRVAEARSVVVQADLMQNELDSGLSCDYSVESLPLLLLEFFIERMGHLVQSKHMHMLRWRRFCEHTSAIEQMYPDYQNRLFEIMTEYSDCTQRAQRLSVAREHILNDKPGHAVTAVKKEDIEIYLRWLVCHFHSVKLFNQFMRVLQWLPLTRKKDVSLAKPEEEEEELSHSARIPDRYKEESELQPEKSTIKMSSIVPGVIPEEEKPLSPPPAPPVITTSTNLASSQMTYAAAAAGGGLASCEETLGIPLHNNNTDEMKPMLKFFVNIYAISCMIDQMSLSGDEMELFALANKKFRQMFQRQETMKQFKTYDRVEIGQEHWGADHSTHCLKKESNWTDFLKIKPEVDAGQERVMVMLRTRNNIDLLLKAMSQFMHIGDVDAVQDAFRSHALSVREPVEINPIRVTSHKTTNNPAAIWKRIYTNPNLLVNSDNELDMALQELQVDEKDIEQVNFGRQKIKKRTSSYDYTNTIQLLGLDEGDAASDEPGSIQGAFHSFLQLRHLRVRDLQRSALSVFNYFRSIERTITINHEGLSVEFGKYRRMSAQNHRKYHKDSSQGGGGGLGSHHYVHSSPADFKMDETEFMEYTDVENHDDFYTFDEGRIHVQDQRGFYIMYDAACKDFDELEREVLLVGTHYIQKDKELRNASRMSRLCTGKRNTAGDFDIPSYGHQEVDRFGVILDMWSCETAFMQAKKDVLDVYYEAYQHVFDRDEKKALAQVLINIMYQRPRLDFDANYFVRSYRMECINMRLHLDIVASLLDRQIDEQREYVQKINSLTHQFGLPHRIIDKQPISVNLSRSALRNVYMFEFHPSLAIAGRLPEALKNVYWEFHNQHHPSTVSDVLQLEKNVLEVVLKEWNSMPKVGASYANHVQKEVFGDHFIENPVMVGEVSQRIVLECEKKNSRGSMRDQQVALIKALGQLLDAITIRSRIIDAANEMEILSKIYKQQAVSMGFEECHAFIRFIQFEYAPRNTSINKPPVFITAIHEDDTDKFMPNFQTLGVHELDESHVGRLSFQSIDAMKQTLRDGGIESLRACLMCQIVQKNIFLVAVQQAHQCQPIKEISSSHGHQRSASPIDTKSERSSIMTGATGNSARGEASNTGNKRSSGFEKNFPESFVSIQLEKAPCRDAMLNEFIKKKLTMGNVLKNPVEMEKLKRKMILEYCYGLQKRIRQFSMRGQLIGYYTSLLRLLENYPEFRDQYFMVGTANEKKDSKEEKTDKKEEASKKQRQSVTFALAGDPTPNQEGEPEPFEFCPATLHLRTFKKRPRRVLSNDGRIVQNIWFLPHMSELLIMYKTLDDDKCLSALYNHLRIAGGLHDLMQYFVFMSKIKLSKEHSEYAGSEAMFASGSELQEIQKQVDHLPDGTNPAMVADLLNLRKEVTFLEFDVAVRISMNENFLSTGNLPAHRALARTMNHALCKICNCMEPSFHSMYLNVPEPLEAFHPQAKVLFPWRTYINDNGFFPLQFWHWQQIPYYLEISLAGLKDTDKDVASGEVLGISLMMDDVLSGSDQDRNLTLAHEEGEEAPKKEQIQTSPPDKKGAVKKDKIEALDILKKTSLSKVGQPLTSYKVLRSFLLLWKRVDVFKMHWGKTKMAAQEFHSMKEYSQYVSDFRKEILYPVLQAISRRYGQGDVFDIMLSSNMPITTPKGATEIEVKIKVLQKLLEGLECHMIAEVRKKLSRELNQVISERARDDSTLPTDLWKRSSMKENFTTHRPHIAERFTDRIMSEAEVDEDRTKIILEYEHFSHCLNKLARDVMTRERQNYDSYSMFYENLLRIHHQTLYTREQDIKHLKDTIKTLRDTSYAETQCQLADENQALLLEVTALRAKIGEMREVSLTQERDIRSRVKEEYDNLVQNLFSSAFDIQRKFDVFKEELYDDVYEKIREVRTEAVVAMAKLKARSLGTEIEAPETNPELKQAERYRAIQQENNALTILMLKRKAINTWKTSFDRIMNDKKIAQAKRESDKNKKEGITIRMMAAEEIILLRQQLIAIRRGLKDSEAECENLRKELNKLVKDKKEKDHAMMNKHKSQRQLEATKRANVDKLLEELEDKDSRLKNLADEQDKIRRLQFMSHEKSRKEVEAVKKQLLHERHLKLDAYSRVDELQTQVYDMDGLAITSRPDTAYDGLKSRPASSMVTRKSQLVSMTGVWPPPISRPPHRPFTSVGHRSVDALDKKIQRPQTTTGRLRSRIADQLMHDLEPPSHVESLKRLQAEQKAC